MFVIAPYSRPDDKTSFSVSCSARMSLFDASLDRTFVELRLDSGGISILRMLYSKSSGHQHPAVRLDVPRVAMIEAGTSAVAFVLKETLTLVR
jgi:hypothetical protein